MHESDNLNKGEKTMEIIRTNIEDNEWTMDLSYDMLESDERHSMKVLAGADKVHVEKYILYKDENAQGEEQNFLVIKCINGFFVTTSPSFIRKFTRILECASRSGVTDINIAVEEIETKNRRKCLSCKYEK